MRRHKQASIALSLIVLGAAACGESISDKSGDSALDPGGGGSGEVTDPNSGAPGDPGFRLDGGNRAGSGAGDQACATQSAKAELAPAHLLFLLDQSESMGKAVRDYAVKWGPVTLALTGQCDSDPCGIVGFMEDPASRGTKASLTLFPPPDGADGCDPDSYEEPFVPLTALPTDVFKRTLYEEVPLPTGGNTPSAAVLAGITPEARRLKQEGAQNIAIVLVTDGLPTPCAPDGSFGDADAQAERELKQQARRTVEVAPIYVVGLGLDSERADTRLLNEVASIGGTDGAFLVRVGAIEQTKEDFLDAVTAIRGAVSPCSVSVPEPPPGKDFTQVTVSYRHGDSAAKAVEYSADCSNAGGWHYDDPGAPSRIELCENACSAVRSSGEAQLNVAFGCESVITLK